MLSNVQAVALAVKLREFIKIMLQQQQQTSTRAAGAFQAAHTPSEVIHTLLAVPSGVTLTLIPTKAGSPSGELQPLLAPCLPDAANLTLKGLS